MTHHIEVYIKLSETKQSVQLAIREDDKEWTTTAHPVELLYERLTEPINRIVRQIANDIERKELKEGT